MVLAPARAMGGPPTPLQAGEPAPFGGLLLDHGHAAALLRAEPQRDRARAEARGLRARLVRTEADLSAERAQREADRAEAKARELAWADALGRCEGVARKSVEPPAWYERPAFVIPATAAVTLGVVLSIVFATR